MVGSQRKNSQLAGGDHPPKKKREQRLLITIILPYSPKKKRANPMEEYSTWYPATSSALASGKSKGALLASARQEIKKSVCQCRAHRLQHMYQKRKKHAAPELGQMGLLQSHPRASGDLPGTVALKPLQPPLLLHSLVPQRIQTLHPRPSSLLTPM